MTEYIIPVLSKNQTFSITLNGVDYLIQLVWNEVTQCWCLDLILNSTKVKLIGNIPLLPGVDLFEQFAYLRLGGQLIVQTDNPRAAPPNSKNLGIENSLRFVVI